MKKLLAIRHVMYEDLDGFESAFQSRGYAIEYRDAWFDTERIDALAPDILVVLGAPVGVYELEYPFIEEEIEAVKQRIAAKKPVLGICFGAQILARALGAQVYKGPQFEFGWAPLTLTEAGKNSPIRHYAEQERYAFHCHGDTFDLPVGSRLLAYTYMYPNQAFDHGPHLGLQFHGEVTERGLRRWYIGHTGRIRSTIGLQRLKADTDIFAPRLEPVLQQVIHDWLDSPVS
jgi:GMP synthase (glutamine-hydrolysing)